MTAPLAGRDTAAYFKGLIIGFIGIALIVLVTVHLTNKKFEAHEQPAAGATH